MAENFLLSEDLADIQSLVADFFRQSFDSEFLRKRLISEDITDEVQSENTESWKTISEMGLLSASISEEAGGLSLGLLANEFVLTSAGNSLVPLPLQETIYFGLLPLLLLTKGKQELLEKIGSGMSICTGVPLSANGEFCELKIGKDLSITGEVFFVSNFSSSNTLVVPVLDKDEGKILKGSIFVFDLSSANAGFLKSTKLESIDMTRELVRLELSKAVPESVLPFELDRECFETYNATLGLLIASELSGIGKKVIELTSEYLHDRKQFGKPIGSFQALQHALSDQFLVVSQVSALVRMAFWSYENDSDQFLEAAVGAYVLATDEIPTVVEKTIQLHGGIGFTFEHDLHLYLRRAQFLAAAYKDKEQVLHGLVENCK